MVEGSNAIISTQVIELDNCNENIISKLVEEGNVRTIQQAVEACPQMIDWKFESTKETALHHACDVGNPLVTQCLIDLGFSKIARDNNEFTPLITASRQGHLHCVNILTQTSQHIEAVDKNGWTALVWACYKGRTQVVEKLVQLGAKVDVAVSYNMTSLLWASSRGFKDIVALLCRKGANVNHCDKFGNTALLWASRRGYVEIVKKLLEFGADQNTIGANGVTALITAIRGKYLECACTILDHPNTNVNQSSREGHTALSLACRHGEVDVVRKLVERGAFVNTPDDEGETPLMKAVKQGHADTVDQMLLRFAEVDARNKNGKTALHMAVENGSFLNVRALLNCNANVEALDSNHQTALFLAVKLKRYKISKLLVEHGACINTTDKHDDLPIHLAMRSRNLPLVELLLHEPKNACTLYYTNQAGETAYEIDKANETNILSQLFGTSSKSLAYNDRFDIYNHCLAEMLTEPAFQTPICVSLYAKCRSGLSFVLDNFKRQVSNYQPLAKKHSSKGRRKILWITYFLVVYVPLIFGLLSGVFAADPLLTVLVTTFLLFAIFYLFIVFINNDAAKKRWWWIERSCSFFHQKQTYLLLLFKILFMKHYKSDKNSSAMRYIVVGPLNILNIGQQSLEFHFSSCVVKTVENHVGTFAFRLARAMNKNGVIPSHPGERRRWRFRRLCCLPSIIWLAGFLIAKVVILFLLVAYRPHDTASGGEEPSGIDAMPFVYLFAGISGFVLLISLPHTKLLVGSCLDSPARQHRRGVKAAQAGKLHSSKYYYQHGGGNVAIREMCGAVEALDAIQDHHSRIFLLVDGLESTDGEKVLQCVETIHSCFNRQLIVNVICTDYHLLSSAANSNFLRPSSNLNLNGAEYLQNTIQLPIFLAEHVKQKKKKDTSESAYSIKQIHLNLKRQRMQQFDALRTMSLRCEILNPKLMKRITSLLMITARMMRVNDEPFEWESLFSWIILCELWPFAVTCLYSYQLSKRRDGAADMKRLHDEIREQLNLSNEHDHASYSSFVEFLSNDKFRVRLDEMAVYYKYSVNVDPRITSYLPTFIDCAHSSVRCSTTRSVSCASEYADRPYVSNSNRNELKDWTVDDVCAKIRSIPGLDSRNLTRYERFIRVNNLHGSALASCDLDDLKKELKTSFGDWSLIRNFVLRERDTRELPAQKQEPVVVLSEPDTDDALSESRAPTSPASTLVVAPPSHGKHAPKTSSNDEHQQDETANTVTTLNIYDRAAYDAAFKDYLRLQPAATASGAGESPAQRRRVANDNAGVVFELGYDEADDNAESKLLPDDDGGDAMLSAALGGEDFNGNR